MKPGIVTACLWYCIISALGCAGHHHDTTAASSKPVMEETSANSINWQTEYVAALQRAKDGALPLLVYTWASWCRPCHLMEKFVLNHEAMREFADRFVWLILDAENDSNREVFGRLSTTIWPSFYVIKPCDESLVAVREGVAAVDEFADFLNEAEQTFRASEH